MQLLNVNFYKKHIRFIALMAALACLGAYSVEIVKYFELNFYVEHIFIISYLGVVLGIIAWISRLDFYLDNIRVLGAVAIFVGLGAWYMDIMEYVYICKYCRTERTIIALLGVIMMFPSTKHFMVRYVTLILGLYGLAITSRHHFMGWSDINDGERWGFHEPWFMDPFVLSFLAIGILTAQVCLIFLNKK